MKAVELKELSETLVSDDTLILVVNPDGPGRAALKDVRGLGLSEQESFFLVTSISSGITTDSEGWQKVPQVTTAANRYLWSYTQFTYTDGKVVTTPPAIVGVHGNTGPQGIQGVKGDTGEPFTIARTFPSIADMNNGYDSDGVKIGSFVVIDTGDINDEDNAKLFLKSEKAYTYITDLSGVQGIQGPKGDPGPQGPNGGISSNEVINLVYPVGSLYWSSKPTNPAALFGGEWVQIKDKFILAAGDTYPANSIDGNANTTLTVENLPRHTHSFTPNGSVSAHSHGLNNHTHSFNWSGSHGHDVVYSSAQSLKEVYYFGGQNKGIVGNSVSADSGREHTDATGYIMAKPTTISVSGTTGQTSGNTASATPTFTGNAGTTGNTGSGTAFSNMPPYVVKYCWERTA